jgi:FAD/FMN-containing dehydrogenase
MQTTLLEELKNIVKGDVLFDEKTLMDFSHDASIFEVKPQVVVFPKDKEDVERLVSFVSEKKKNHPTLSLTGRSAGTDMSGGPINDSIVVGFTKYFNHTPTVENNVATTQPGVYYRDFEKKTLKHGMIFPSYPASREICAMGGIVNNNSAGEKSLEYGKTEKYLKKVKVVLSDGKTYEFKPLNKSQLAEKMKEATFEGKIYKKIYGLILENYEDIMAAKPTVSKNSAGYFLWNIWDKQTGTFDLTQLWVGSQGTLGLLLSADLGLVPVRKHRGMMIISLPDMSQLGQIIDKVLPLKPESFESYDDNTLRLAMKYFHEFSHKLGIWGTVQAALAFLPTFIQTLTGNLPKLVLQVDFTSNDPQEIKEKMAMLQQSLKGLRLKTKVAFGNEENKYWMIRRESFNLLRNKIKDKHTAPFIDDFVIHPHDIAEVLPKVTDILKQHPEFIFTVAGHIGEGNFHIIPIVDFGDKRIKTAIPKISEQVFEIVIQRGGSMSGEHNDGLIRTTYLTQMYGKKIVNLFRQVKEIFDPHYIFNPRKKVGGSLEYSMNHLRHNW